ncbi:large subunit of -dimethylformamidase protein [Purpureocillium lilacinum]|uniref:Large subunit of-dimethylformamidase protein n=1 Tax=Purpureocillium lilacinum TaxID=33203 RepID=A0A179HB27_PURLI|nr:large subunit of -dimethylformamidase protein [Purpureocillium lilacinum]OAQ86703.1 large subunit of -dimethylformamidase protein [Purpureocillium lilacinum]OAQ94664.1 large subunit of -dimethylformamidase protein [Purpureocillium lilacinum]PWI70525.1 hypothetical protein PCL_12924 [Purpureocillium lilacinum]
MATPGGHFADAEISTGSALDGKYLDEDEVIGYVEPWMASPGERVDVKVSSTIPKYTWTLVRIVQGLEHPKAPEVKKELVFKPTPGSDIIDGSYRRCNSGSYAVVDSWKAIPNERIMGVRLSCFVEPWLLEAGHDQALISCLDAHNSSGFALLLNKSGTLCFYVGSGDAIQQFDTGIRLRHRRWAEVKLSIDTRQLAVHARHCENLAEIYPEPADFCAPIPGPLALTGSSPLTLAAGLFGEDLRPAATAASFFNGRLDSPHIELSYDGNTYITWASYDFSLNIPTDKITDTSEKVHHGVLVNAPTRAVRDHSWDGAEPDWTKAKYGYGAIHFHEDDLDDAMWPTDFTVQVPNDAPSGAYAVIVQGADEEHRHITDAITFFVRPDPRSQATRPKTAIVLSTFTYLAYANEHMYDQSRASRMELSGGVPIRKDANWRRMARRADLGCSLYDVHRDGSGAVFTSSRRPILNIRPDYINWAFHRPREFSADQLMIGFLEQQLGRGGYDVLTDHDVHLQGVDALAGYKVVITGCHPEYPSLEMLNAYRAFANRGGSIMYLGGNGFYWCAVVDPARPHRVEVRKGDQGCRSIELPAGERVHSLNGAHGGLWRARGRTPQSLFGIGSCACGNGLGVPYRFSDEVTRSGGFAWLFEGLERDEAGNVALLGTEGFGGGASGDEIDRLDFGLGTPSNTVLLATSTGHDDTFGLFNEETMFPMVNTVGSACAKIRSDMVMYETNGGGFIFSVGSINWYCSLGWNKYDNDVARLTWNVLRRLLSGSETRGGASDSAAAATAAVA